ncbi:MAG TPA: translation initiation factor IF-2, partial [Candidatus Lokiarchaeia archaeon]|nr:translation initiation factor IF-2 [Candidatus Lokiarchaeia archaeon]
MAKKAAKKAAKKSAKKAVKRPVPEEEPSDGTLDAEGTPFEGEESENAPEPKETTESPALTEEDLTARAQMAVGDKVVRSPLVCVLGHTNHGKTTLLDYIRGTVVAKREAGLLTQHIGASFIPVDAIRKFCGPKYANIELKIPGLLVLDTPGHAAFMNLRKRGGGVADIAILVVDVSSGSQPITWESVHILRERRTPFIIAANKIDRITGWESTKDADFLDSYNRQKPWIKEDLDNRIYTIIGDFTQEGFSGVERYDRITDFTSNIAIVPISAKTGEGVPTLLIVLAGLVQQFLQKNIQYSDGPGKGVVLEVKNETGYGTTIDCLLYDGYLKKGSDIVVGTPEGAIVTKIRNPLIPKPLDEIRDPRNKFDQAEILYAAAGVKILAPNLENIVAGSPFRMVESPDKLEDEIAEINAEINAIQIKTEKTGVVLKADALGSLEALVGFLHQNEVKIHKASVGPVTRNDIMDAMAIKERDPLFGVVLAFNVNVLGDAQETADDLGIRIFSQDVIYKLLEEYQGYYSTRKAEDTAAALSEVMLPGTFKV